MESNKYVFNLNKMTHELKELLHRRWLWYFRFVLFHYGNIKWNPLEDNKYWPIAEKSTQHCIVNFSMLGLNQKFFLDKYKSEDMYLIFNSKYAYKKSGQNVNGNNFSDEILFILYMKISIYFKYITRNIWNVIYIKKISKKVK